MIRSTYLRLSDTLRDCPATTLAIGILWLLLIVPAAFLNGLFSLDVGGVFNHSSYFPQNLRWVLSPYNGSGRYFPLYWLYHDFLYVIWSVDTRAYYLVQSGIFLLAAVLIGRLFDSVAARGRLALFFALSLFLSTPNVETLYTLGKAEPLAFCFITSILWLFYRRKQADTPFSLPACAAVAVLFTCAMLSKETSMALFAFAGMGIVLAFLSGRCPSLANGAVAARKRYVRLMLALAAGFAISKIPYLVYAGRSGNVPATYTTFKLTTKIVLDNIWFYSTQQPDVAGFGFLAAWLLFLLLKHALRRTDALDEKTSGDLIFVVSLLGMAAAYGSIFIIWRWSMAYYLFIPAIFFRFAAMYGIHMTRQWKLVTGRSHTVCNAAMGLMLVYAAIYSWYTGSSQAAYSRMYEEALQRCVKLTKPGDSITLESYPFYSEQVTNTEQLFSVIYHEKRRLFGIGDLVNPAMITNEMRELLGVTDADLANNEKNYPKPNDYVIAFTGNKLATWQIRGVAPFYSDGSELQKDGNYEMELLASDRLYDPGMFVNVWTSLPDIRQTYVGYEIYKVISGPRFTWVGKHLDNWIGKRARLTLYPPFVGRAIVHVATSKYNPNNTVQVFSNGVLLDSAVLKEGTEHSFELTVGTQPTEFEFKVSRTFVPRRLYLNRDTRELGVLVRLEPFAPKKPQTPPVESTR